MITIHIFNKAGTFAENKDIARDLRMKKIIPALKQNQKIIIDFDKVEAATQSFIHALISDILRKYGPAILEQISFKSCNITVKKIIEIVIILIVFLPNMSNNSLFLLHTSPALNEFGELDYLSKPKSSHIILYHIQKFWA